jgi:hypothetical protein
VVYFNVFFSRFVAKSHITHNLLQVKNYKGLLKFIFGQLLYAFRDGFEVEDAHLQTRRQVFLYLAWGIEDSRGLPHVCGCSSAPAYKGGCPFCRIRGVRHHTTVYPGAVARLPRDHPTRAAATAVFRGGNMGMQRLGETPPPLMMTTAVAVASGMRVEQKVSGKDEEWYVAVDTFTELFGEDFDKVQRFGHDPAHGLANLVANMSQSISDTNKMKLTKKKLALEHAMGRFRNLRSAKNAPWTASKKRLEQVDLLLRELRIPTDWPCIQDAFTGASSLKIAESIALIGDLGLYVMSVLDISPLYRNLFQDTIIAFRPLLAKAPTRWPPPRDEDAAIQKAIVAALAALEVNMPLHWCTSTTHFLLHAMLKVDLMGYVVIISLLIPTLRCLFARFVASWHVSCIISTFRVLFLRFVSNSYVSCLIPTFRVLFLRFV